MNTNLETGEENPNLIYNETVAFCIPTTSNGRDWNTFDDSYLNQILLPSLSISIHKVILYIGYDKNDKVFGNYKNRPKTYKGIKLNWYSFNDDYKGNPCGIWNELIRMSIMDKIEYYMVLGDDISLDQNKLWLDVFLKKLKQNNNIGYSAGWSNNDQIPTQFLIHKRHIDIFGWMFPPQIKNYYCDNFIAELYGDKYGNWLKEYRHLNIGGTPRYTPNDDRNLCNILVRKNKKLLKSYLDKNKLRK